jgi:copper(I)-binding protein
MMAVAVLSVFLAGSATAGDIAVENAFARASVGGAKVAAAYMTLTNTGVVADALVAAETPVAARAELHTNIQDGDIMRMRPVEAIEVPPGGTVRLEPGGLHLMLIDLRSPLKQGERVPLTLTFARTGKQTIDVPVEGPAAMPMQQHEMQGNEPMMHGPQK